MANLDPLEYLSRLQSKGINLDLGPITRLLQSLGNPQLQYKTILIGGSNGKGSVAAIISSILHAAGVNAGLYTSPHLIDFKERIRVNDQIIEEEDLLTLIDQVREASKEDVTYFEFATALAFLYFYKRHVDIAVLEVGMGGRLDATNVVYPEVSVITNICIEHQKYLGRDLSAIAREKGGIIKEGGVCLTAARQNKVLHVLEEIAGRKRSRLYQAGRDFRIKMSRDESFSYYGILKKYRNLTVPLIGKHQIQNTALALGAIEILGTGGLEVREESIAKGLRNVRWEGRLEILNNLPRLVVDGAHNPAAASVLCRSLKSCFTYRQLILIFGILDDKHYKKMLGILGPLADRIILTRPEVKRGRPPEMLLPFTRKSNHNVDVIENSEKALVRAFALADKNDLICVTGSLYLVGEIKKAFPYLVPERKVMFRQNPNIKMRNSKQIRIPNDKMP